MIRSTSLAAALAVTLTGAVTLHAAILASEDFDYNGSASPGTALGQASGGSGWVTNWSGSFSSATNANGTVVTGSLDNNANPFTTVGNSMRAGGGASYRQFSSTPLVNRDSNAEFYFSFMFRAESVGSGSGDLFKLRDTGNGFDHFTFGFNTSSQWAVGGGYGSGGSGSGTTAAAGSGTGAGAAFATGTDFFVIGKIVTSTSGNDVAYVQVYGNTGSVSPTDNLSTSNLLNYSVNRTGNQGAAVLQINTGGGGTAALIDGVRLGSTYADVAVVPEPASLAGLALAGLLAGRRRR